MLERFALDEIVHWNEIRIKPLLLNGPRQVGKTYLMKNLFAERYYKDRYFYIDFSHDQEIRNFVNSGGKNGSSICNPEDIMRFISYRERKEINEDTLLIFDEIQDALPVLTSLKYFKQDFPKIPVIASGSMVSIKLKRNATIGRQHHQQPFFYPVGGMSQIYIHPMTFGEYLYNANKMLYDRIVESYKSKSPVESYIHDLAMNYLYKFLIVGGMPENVEMALNEMSMLSIQENISAIFDNYLNDMELYQASPESIVRSRMVFQHIYAQLDKEHKDFKGSLIEGGLRNRDFNSPIDWLTLTGAVNKSIALDERITLPFVSKMDASFRLYLLDVGLLSQQSGIDLHTFLEPRTNNSLFGVLFENYVASELTAKGIPLYYWKGKNYAEFEFVVAIHGKPVPIDVKKGRGSLNSLEKFRNHNKSDAAIKISSNNFGYDSVNRIYTIPLYMAFCLANDIAKAKDSFEPFSLF